MRRKVTVFWRILFLQSKDLHQALVAVLLGEALSSHFSWKVCIYKGQYEKYRFKDIAGIA